MRAASEWADRALRAHGGSLSAWPYGSDAWLGLAEDHPAMLGATVLAAECWRLEGLYLREDLGDADSMLDYILTARMRSASWDIAGAPETWVALRRAGIRSQAERHRAMVAARYDENNTGGAA
jgi:hypothetical protein